MDEDCPFKVLLELTLMLFVVDTACSGTPYFIVQLPGETATTGKPFATDIEIGVFETELSVEFWGSVRVKL